MAKAKRTPAPPRDLKGRSFAFFGEFSIWPTYHSDAPAEVARRRGAKIQTTVTEDLDVLVLGDRRGTGRADAKKKAEKIRAKQQKDKSGHQLEILDEAAYRELVKLDVAGKRFAFYGGFDCAPADFEDGLLSQMVAQAGGLVQKDVDEQLDYLVLGNRRGEKKIAAKNAAEKLREAGGKLEILTEAGFLELVRVEKPAAAGMDFAAFIGNLHGTVDPKKLARALAMLKGEAFKLYVHLDENRLVGVVRSQTGVGSVYSSWLTPEGRYGCSTPELDDCMGLQGSPCKHLLVVLVGLTRGGQMDPAQAYAWIKETVGKRPKTDKELAAETFVNYKSAEAGELDWRPMETIPEDFYAF